MGRTRASWVTTQQAKIGFAFQDKGVYGQWFTHGTYEVDE